MSQPTEITRVTATATPPARVRPYRLSVAQYLRMIAAEIFPASARVELLDGMLVEQMTKGIPHDFTLGQICEALRPLLPTEMILREDKSLRLGPRSRPEPDIAVVSGPATLYREQDPHARDTFLIVEVADTSYAPDRGLKWTRYAAAGIPVYWIINLPQRQVEIYRDPGGKGKKAAYQTTEVYGETVAVPVVIAGVAVGRINVGEILP